MQQSKAEAKTKLVTSYTLHEPQFAEHGLSLINKANPFYNYRYTHIFALISRLVFRVGASINTTLFIGIHTYNTTCIHFQKKILTVDIFFSLCIVSMASRKPRFCNPPSIHRLNKIIA